MDEVQAGEIVAITGIPECNIGETIADINEPHALPPIVVEPPTVRMTFGVNTSPFSGREATWGTSRKLMERLERELERNVALRVEPTDAADTFLVSGRGELHLAILIETMRREGYEFQVSAPEVILQEDPDTGEIMEPMEEVHIEVPTDYTGVVAEMLGQRKGQMTNMHQDQNGTVYYTYIAPTRGLLGFRQSFLTATRGTGIVHTLFQGYGPHVGPIRQRNHGSLVAWEAGTATPYAMFNAQERGRLFILPGTEIYEGMIVGATPRDEDLTLSVTKKEAPDQPSRRPAAISSCTWTSPVQMSLDDAIEYIAQDELVEVTPKNIRLRKRILDTEERRKARKTRSGAAADGNGSDEG